MNQNNEIAVCMCLVDSTFYTQLCISKLVQTTKQKFRFYICYIGSDPEKFSEYIEQLRSIHPDVYSKTFPTETTFQVAMNFLFKNVYQQFCCVVQPNVIVQKNWLEDLLISINSVDSAGFVNIKNSAEEIPLTYVFRSDKTEIDDFSELVYMHKVISCSSIFMFNTSILDNTGFLDENLNHSSISILDLAFRFSALGNKNYYVLEQNYIEIPYEMHPIPWLVHSSESKQELKESIQTMSKQRIFKK